MGGPRVSWEGQFQEDPVARMGALLSVYRCILHLILLSMANLVTATPLGRRETVWKKKDSAYIITPYEMVS